MGGRVMNTRTRKLLLNILKWAVLIVVMLFLLFPIYWVVLTSLDRKSTRLNSSH